LHVVVITYLKDLDFDLYSLLVTILYVYVLNVSVAAKIIVLETNLKRFCVHGTVFFFFISFVIQFEFTLVCTVMGLPVFVCFYINWSKKRSFLLSDRFE